MTPYYQDNLVTLYHGNCYDVLSALPKVNLVLTDPPYVVAAKGCGLAGNRKYLQEITAQRLDTGFDVGFLRRFPNWFCFCGKQQLFQFQEIVQGKNWMLLTWNKPNPTPLTNNNYLPDTEYIFHVWESGRLFGAYEDKSRFFTLPVEKNNSEHPTVKPLSLMRKLVRLGSQLGELLLDPFAGSGTSLVAAKELNRQAIGIEVSEAYCEMAAKRLEISQPALFIAPSRERSEQSAIFTEASA